jgi:hypothetical protein
MNKLDPNKLFNIFNATDESVYEEHNIQHLLQNPYVLMGMVVRGLENYSIIDGMYMMRYKEQYESVREVVKEQFYDRLYNYLLRIDYHNFENTHNISHDYDKTGIHYALNHLLLYYQEKEYYERCALLKNFEDLLRSTFVYPRYDYNIDSLLEELNLKPLQD